MSQCINTGSDHGSEKWKSEPICRCASCDLYFSMKRRNEVAESVLQRLEKLIAAYVDTGVYAIKTQTLTKLVADIREGK